jgi:hypothetical protein
LSLLASFEVYTSNDANKDKYIYIIWTIEQNNFFVVEKIPVAQYIKYLAMCPAPLWIKGSAGQHFASPPGIIRRGVFTHFH